MAGGLLGCGGHPLVVRHSQSRSSYVGPEFAKIPWYLAKGGGVDVKQVAVRFLTGGRSGWSPEVAMRYLPVVDILRAEGVDEAVTEIGSGGSGIAPYLGKRVVGVDTDFTSGHSGLLDQVPGSALSIPFKNASCPAVVSVDMLEHIPPDLRRVAVRELVRVTARLLVLVFPEGGASERQDEDLAALYARRHPEGYRYFDEHLEYGLPRKADVAAWIDEAVILHGRQASIAWYRNSELARRRQLMRLWAHGTIPSRLIQLATVRWSDRLAKVAPGDDAYRVCAVIRFAVDGA